MPAVVKQSDCFKGGQSVEHSLVLGWGTICWPLPFARGYQRIVALGEYFALNKRGDQTFGHTTLLVRKRATPAIPANDDNVRGASFLARPRRKTEAALTTQGPVF